MEQVDPRQIDMESLSMAIGTVVTERQLALNQHGPLKPGPERWSRLLQEEMQEVEDEFSLVNCPGPEYAETRQEARARAIVELAQLAQLAIGVIELLQQGKTEEDTTSGNSSK